MAEVGAMEIAQLIRDLTEPQKIIFQTQYASERKDRGTCVVLSLFLYDRLWLGDTGLGILKYLTAGGCGIWAIIDLFTAGSRCDNYNRRKAHEIFQAIRMS